MKIKKHLAAALVVLLTASQTLTLTAHGEEYEIEAPHMYAHAYAVMDANSGKVLFGENVDKKIYPASTAKLMSAIVAVESGMNLDTVIKTRGKIVNHTTPGTYNLGMNGGEEYSLSNLLHMSLMASAADATDTMAAGIYGSRQSFADKMNEKAKELGLTQTSFDNPVGSDIGGGFNKTYSTAREMSEITRYAMTLEPIRKITAKTRYIIRGKGSQSGRQISNTNWFYTQMPYNDEYFTIIGSKTGTTNAAGQVFIATAIDDEGHELICSYFGKESKESTFRWINSLLTRAFKAYKKGDLTLTKGAYNVRYNKDALCYCRSMDAGYLRQNSSHQVSLDETVTKEQATGILCASLSPETDGTRIPCYYDSLKGDNSSCDKEFLCKSLEKALPGITKSPSVQKTMADLPDTITVENVVHLAQSAVNYFPLYSMSFPTYEMRTWNKDNLVPFMSPANLSMDLLTGTGF